MFGEFPVREVLVEAGPFDGPTEFVNYGTVFPHELGRPRRGFQFGFQPELTRAIFHFVINGSSGSFGQAVLLRRIGQHWVWLSRIYKGGRPKPFRQWSSPDFPREILEKSWDKD
jgi:hypothetical protein